MALKTTERLIGPPRGDRVTAVNAAARMGAKRLDDVDRAITEAYRICPLVSLDPAIIVAQAFTETGNWRNRWFVERNNMGSLGVTGDPDQNEASPKFATPEDGMRAMIAHDLLYAMGESQASSIWGDATGMSLRESDPRYDAYIDAYGYVAIAPTIAGLAGTYAADRNYANAIVERAAEIWPNLPDQEDTPTMPDAPFPFEKRLTTRDLGRFVIPDLWITIHNNGNPTSDRFDEAAFVQSGGGASGVLYHFAVDAGGVVQIEKLDRRGVHAGNVQGNASSVAFEMCVGSEPWATVKEYSAQLIAEIVTNHRGILDYGMVGPVNFSLDRIREHRQWPGANPACPARLIAEDGGAGGVIARARQLVAEWSEPEEPEPIWPREPIKVPDLIESQGHALSVNKPTRFKAIHGTTLRTAPNREAPAVRKPPIKRGKVYSFGYRATVDGEDWLVSSLGSWALASAFEPS